MNKDNFKLKNWVYKMKLGSKVMSPEIKKSANFFKTSIISILVGFILTCIVISFLGANPFDYFLRTINVVFTRPINLKIFITWIAVYGLFGIGLAIGFKIGLFNMSGSGQAILSMGISGLMLISLFGADGIKDAPPTILMLVLLVMVVSSMALSTITGLLKVFFNIHEVATSILLNWTVWYIMKWAFSEKGFISSSPKIPTSWIEVGGTTWVIPIILMILVFVSAWLILTFTTIGYKFKLVGKQKEVAQYTGINFKKYIVVATALQGLCIGLGSFVYWTGIKGGYSLGNDLIPTIGFDAIAIALIAGNNILGIVPVAIFWGLLQTGMPMAVSQYPTLGREIAPLAFGIMVYTSTFVVLFARLNVIKRIKFGIYYYKDIYTREKVSRIREKIKLVKKSIMEIKKNSFSDEQIELKVIYSRLNDLKKNNNKNPNEIKKLSIEFLKLKRDKLFILDREYEVLKSDIKALKEEGYEKSLVTGVNSIKKSYINIYLKNKYKYLNEAVKDLNTIEELKTEAAIKLKSIKKDKRGINQEELDKLNIQIEKNKKIEKKLNITWMENIENLNILKQELFSERDINSKIAKDKYNEFVMNNKDLQKEELLKAKFNKSIELGEEYGRK